MHECSARWIGNHGFSIGIDDVQPGDQLVKKKQTTILEGYRDCDKQINLFNTGNLPPEAGCDAAQSLEAKITQILNGIREATANVRLIGLFPFLYYKSYHLLSSCHESYSV